jgi:hypothetical protein
VGDPQRSEYLRGLLERWWLLTAQAAQAKPEAFDLWRLYRTQPRPAAASEPLLGPFAPVPALVERALVRNTWPQPKAVPVSVVVASLAGQWTAAVDVVLSDAACRADAALTTQVLTQTYAGWWQSLDWHKFVEADWRYAAAAPKPKPKPQPQPNPWLTAFAKALETHQGVPAPRPVGGPVASGVKGTLLPKPGDEPNKSPSGS